MPPQALGCIVKELFRHITGLFRNAPRSSQTLFNCIRHRRRQARCRTRCFGDLFAGSSYHCF
jgi:hypothetical protein